MEFCKLYILEQDYAKASFCCEELILQNPTINGKARLG
jgi:hypothetical protein